MTNAGPTAYREMYHGPADGSGPPPLLVLFAVPGLRVGGTEGQLLLLVEGLLRRGRRCEVFALDANGDMKARLAALGVAVHDGSYEPEAGAPRRAALALRGLWRLWQLAVRRRPAVLHAFLPLANVLGALAGHLARVPVVVTSRRALGTHQSRYPLSRYLDRLANRLSDVVTANSQAVIEDTIARDGIAPDKMKLVRNGLDFARLDAQASDRATVRVSLGLAAATPVLAVVANLLPYKGHADLIEAIARLKPRVQPTQFLLVGADRGIGPELRARARQRGVADSVTFLGQRSDIGAILAAADGFVLPSHEEGSSNALLEAMAAGLPIVATDIGGTREALGDGAFGALVPPRDPASLAAAIDRLLDGLADESGPVRAQAAAAQVAVRAAYDVDRMVEAQLAIYRERLNAAAARPASSTPTARRRPRSRPADRRH